MVRIKLSWGTVEARRVVVSFIVAASRHSTVPPLPFHVHKKLIKIPCESHRQSWPAAGSKLSELHLQKVNYLRVAAEEFSIFPPIGRGQVEAILDPIGIATTDTSDEFNEIPDVLKFCSSKSRHVLRRRRTFLIFLCG